MALVCGQYEAAAALIAAGAELTSRNARGCLVFFKSVAKRFPHFSHVRRLFWGNWQAGLFFWPIQGLTPKKFIQENWVPECLQDALEGRLESCQRVALLARGWVEMKF